jgi:hypothetical protein
LSGNLLTTGRGFAETVKSTLLSTSTLSVDLPGGVSGRLHIYFLSRPLEGGITAPGSLDELESAALDSFLGFLRVAPGSEAPLSRLESRVRVLLRDVQECMLPGKEEAAFALLRAESDAGPEDAEDEEDDEGFARLCESSLAVSLQKALSEATADLCEVCEEAGGGGDDESARDTLVKQILLCLQRFASRQLHDSVLQLLKRTACTRALERHGELMRRVVSLTPEQCGVKPAFVCALPSAPASWRTVGASPCPLSKLQALAGVTAGIRGDLETHLVRRGVDLGEVDFGADDLLPMMLMCLGKGGEDKGTEAARELPAHIAFVQLMHHPDAGGLQHSALGYNLANWDQVMRWRG